MNLEKIPVVSEVESIGPNHLLPALNLLKGKRKFLNASTEVFFGL